MSHIRNILTGVGAAVILAVSGWPAAVVSFGYAIIALGLVIAGLGWACGGRS